MKPIRVIITDDEVMTRCLLAGRLAHEPDIEVVGQATTGKEAIELAQDTQPDVALMDLNLPDLSGAVAGERLLERSPRTRVIILTSLAQLAPMARSFGAFAWLNKSCTPQEVIDTIRRAHRAPRVEPGSGRAEALGRLAERFGLTAREATVLTKLVETDLTIQQIANELSREGPEPVSLSSVKHTRDRVMVKLGIEPATRAGLVKRVLEWERQNVQ
jgi:two-component system response regulator DesR